MGEAVRTSCRERGGGGKSLSVRSGGFCFRRQRRKLGEDRGIFLYYDQWGGSYIFDHLGDKDENASSTVTMQMEEFYATAKDADYIIYNSTIEGEMSSMDELLGKSSLLENFKAVQDGNVFCTTRNIYQSSMELGTIISDIHKILTEEEDGLTYIYKLE